jgi:hypothetical protein
MDLRFRQSSYAPVVGGCGTVPAMSENEPSPWRDANGIAAHIGYDEKTIHRLTGPHVRDGIPYHRLTPGGHKMFYVPEVDAWLLGRP